MRSQYPSSPGTDKKKRKGKMKNNTCEDKSVAVKRSHHVGAFIRRLLLLHRGRGGRSSESQEDKGGEEVEQKYVGGAGVGGMKSYVTRAWKLRCCGYILLFFKIWSLRNLHLEMKLSDWVITIFFRP